MMNVRKLAPSLAGIGLGMLFYYAKKMAKTGFDASDVWASLLGNILSSTSSLPPAQPAVATTVEHVVTQDDQSLEWRFVAVTDLDKKSRHRSKFAWTSIVQTASIALDPEKGSWSLDMSHRITFSTDIATKNRSMELSEIDFIQTEPSGEGDLKMIGLCDRTGIVFELDPRQGSAYPLSFIRSGDGKTSKSIFKSEWAAFKDGDLYIGANGKEYTTGLQIDHEDFLFVKRVVQPSSFGLAKVQHLNWKPFFSRLREYAGCEFPGYMIHESVVFEPRMRKWLFLPRKMSADTPYADETDEYLGSNTLFIVSEDLSAISHVTVGPLELEWGFSAFKQIIPPQNAGTKFKKPMFAGIKVRELESEGTQSKLCVFDISGKIYTDPEFIPFSIDMKFEGLAFVPISYPHKDLL